ncbi:heavy metal resistance protein CzcA [Auritidibacter sp. NML120779]|nr:heavy metal resistance protein CzcA [Auritidibacter sp. NML120779]
MSQLLPTLQVQTIQDSLRDYLTTTFGLADSAAQHALEEFLTEEQSGIFRGPYIRTRTPFKPSARTDNPLDITPGKHTPYGHQAEAFARLSTRGLAPHERPKPTLVTTGTGSGKTESFLYPILDHVVRHKRAGGAGISALILYPMNALATDQAQRLAQMITTDPQFQGIRAAIYTGETGDSERSAVTADGLINVREAIRGNPPDILLTNYKMLNQLLLRQADARLWEESALSLQYLVLDEFHTYDGAQGTDVSMLLRRLGLKLKKHWPDSDPRITDDHRQRPLGRVTPVATSATMGDNAGPDDILRFAHTVFGEEFSPDAVVTESRYSVAEWADLPGAELTAQQKQLEAADFDSLNLGAALEWIARGENHEDRALRALATTFRLKRASAETTLAAPDAGEWNNIYSTLGDDSAQWLSTVKRNAWLGQLYDQTRSAVHIRDLAHALIPSARRTTGNVYEYVALVVAGLSLVRSREKLTAPTVDVHLWVRALSRIDREISLQPAFRWFDDGAADDTAAQVLPAQYCRNCGRSGWAAMRSPESELKLAAADSDANIRREAVRGSSAVRTLILAEAEAAEFREHDGDDAYQHERLWGYRVETRDFIKAEDVIGLTVSDEYAAELDEGLIVPVLRFDGKEADERSQSDTCPACGERDAIRFLGAAVATMLSVALSTVFGEHELDADEKKTLVFADSVQDAAHRAGFVESRSHTLTLRAAMAHAAGDGIRLSDLAAAMADAAQTASERYRLLPPEMTGDRFPKIADWWRRPHSPARQGRRQVEKRLEFDAALEFGLQARYGRTLETTGALSALVSLPEGTLDAVDELFTVDAVQAAAEFDDDFFSDPVRREAWVRGVLHHMRTSGAINHEWLDKYKSNRGARIWIWGKRRRKDGMPAFPRGRSAPAFPTVGIKGSSTESAFEPADSPAGWYARYTAKVLGVSKSHGAVLARDLLAKLTSVGLLTCITVENGDGRVYGLEPDNIGLILPDGPAPRLICSVCRTDFPIAEEGAKALEGTPCLLVSCSGQLERNDIGPNFYRGLYRGGNLSRIVAREHSSILSDKTRREYEDGFKGSADNPAAPNVLVATPTLEMGIDIGDLSSVMLASLPRTVASYVQRVGRAGRLTGNALNLAFVTGRGRELATLNNPESIINGAVVPPATYLDAVEIIKRQYLAYLCDLIADDGTAVEPQTALDLFSAGEKPSQYLMALAQKNTHNGPERVDEFLNSLDGFVREAAEELRQWATVNDAQESGLTSALWKARGRYTDEREQLERRLREISASLPDLERAGAVGDDEDKRAFRQARAAQRAAEKALRSHDYWISALELEGLLPNYTLLDDTTELDVSVRWSNEQRGEVEYQSDSFTIERGTSLAIRDFAPGATFYGQGMAIRVDAVDFGIDESDVYTLSLCPECGYTHDSRTSDMTMRECPRCCSQGIADAGQRVPALALRKVLAMVNRDEARISDRDDDRRQRTFEIRALADIDKSKAQRVWYTDGYDFGAAYLSSVAVRTVNFGARASGGPLMVSSEEVKSVGFTVCEGCGQLDSMANENKPTDHRPWCAYRKTLTENNRTLVLTHTLYTQGALLRLPEALLVGDSYAVPSLEAAIRLGLTQRLGGEPTHIGILRTEAPQTEGGVVSALLLHDQVPGGTGYLAELAEPANVWKILWDAWQTVRSCACKTDSVNACSNCILPFEHPGQMVSRASAERALELILTAGRSSMPGPEDVWETTEEEPEKASFASVLEGRFFQVFRERMQKAGMDVRETVDHSGLSRLTLSRPGIALEWTLKPQPQVDGVTKPDFELSCNVPKVPSIYIYTDGFGYHAIHSHQRLADDAAKRAYLRGQGHAVVSLTHDDVETAAVGRQADMPEWFSPKVEAKIIHDKRIDWTTRTTELLRNPMEYLLRLVLDMRSVGADELIPREYTYVGRWAPMFFIRKAVDVDAERGLYTALMEAMTSGDAPAGNDQVSVWKSGPLSVMVQPPTASHSTPTIAALLDDRDYGAEGFMEAWKTWLHLSNLLNFRQLSDGEATIATVTQQQSVDAVPSRRPDVQRAAGIEVESAVPQWARVLDDDLLGDSERQLLGELAQHPGTPVPDIGEESAGGIPMDFSWSEQKVVVLFEPEDEDIADLTDEGWTVVKPTVEDIVATLLVNSGGDS